jgi:hypothetical protein
MELGGERGDQEGEEGEGKVQRRRNKLLFYCPYSSNIQEAISP